jgi:hypothetical protein
MGQRGVHATITQDERTGLITVNHVTVQWSTHIAQIIQFALQHADKEGYTQDEFLKLLKKTVANMEHISAFNCSDEDDTYYDRHGPMEGYCFVTRNHEDGKEYRLGIDEGSGDLLTNYKESERCSTPRAFATRKSAEKFIKEHGHAQDAVSYLWDLDTNQFTFFTNRGALEAYDFATGETVVCKEITYSLDQLRHPNASVKYVSGASSERVVPLYEGQLPDNDDADTDAGAEDPDDDATPQERAYRRLPIAWPTMGGVPNQAVIMLANRSAASYASIVRAEGKEYPANLLTIDPYLKNKGIGRNPFVYDPNLEADRQPPYVVTRFSGDPQQWDGEWEFSKISPKTGRVGLAYTYKVTGSLAEDTLDQLFAKALQGGAHKPDAYYGRTPDWLADFIRDAGTWTVGDSEYWARRCGVEFDNDEQIPEDGAEAQKLFEESALKYADAMDTKLIAFTKGTPLKKRLTTIQRRWLLGTAGRPVMPEEIELSPIAEGKLIEAYVKPWNRSLVIPPMVDTLDKLVYRALAAAVYDRAGNRDAPLTNLRLTAKDSDAIMCAAFSPAWSTAERLNTRRSVIKLSDWIAKH